MVEATDGKGSATRSVAYAGARCGDAVLNGLIGTPIAECAYMQSGVLPEKFPELD